VGYECSGHTELEWECEGWGMGDAYLEYPEVSFGPWASASMEGAMRVEVQAREIRSDTVVLRSESNQLAFAVLLWLR